VIGRIGLLSVNGDGVARLKKIRFGIIAMIIIIIYFVGSKNYQYITPESIRDFLLRFGVFAPLVYIVLFTFVPLTLFPDALLAIAAGLVFGIIPGAIYTMIGALSGGTVAFLITRKLSHGMIESKIEKHKRMSQLIEERGFFIILCLRFIPLIPFDVISYAAGATGIRYREYFLGTLLGIIPGVTILVTLGDGLSSPNQPKVYCAVVALVLLLIFAQKGKTRLLGGPEDSEVQLEH